MSFKNIDKYIKTFPESTQKILQKIRELIQKTAPKAVETISYQMPTFKLNGKVVVHFAGYENHIGLYATPTGHKQFEKELAKYKEGKGSVQFPLGQEIPYDLIVQIVKFRAENLKPIAKKFEVVDGVIIKYHANGKTIWSKGKIEDGKAQGFWQWFRIDGTLKRSGNFEKGQPIGEWITYDSQGKIYKKSKKNNSENWLETLGKPAQRALVNAGIKTTSDLAKWTQEELLKLHGFGPSSLPKVILYLKK